MRSMGGILDCHRKAGTHVMDRNIQLCLTLTTASNKHFSLCVPASCPLRTGSVTFSMYEALIECSVTMGRVLYYPFRTIQRRKFQRGLSPQQTNYENFYFQAFPRGDQKTQILNKHHVFKLEQRDTRLVVISVVKKRTGKYNICSDL